MSHLTPDQLSSHLDGAISGAERVALDRHLSECEGCRKALADLGALDASLGGVLEHDPGEAYFAGFADRVEQRLRAEGVHGAQARGAEDREHRWMDWLRLPRRMAWLGAAAAVIGGAAIVLMTSREDRMSALEESRVAKDARSRAGAPPAEQASGPYAVPSAPGAAVRSTASDETTPTPGLAKTKTADAAGLDKQTDAREKESSRSEVRSEVEHAPGAPAAPAPAPATAERRDAPAAGPRAAAPQRVIEVKRNENGDYVQVNPQPEMTRYAAPPAPAAAPKDGEPMRVRKQNVATPLGLETRQEAAGGTATGDLTPPKEVADQVAPGEIPLCGGVSDGDGRAVSGASVTLARSGHVAFTGPDGQFCIGAPAGDHELVVTAVGFTPRRMQVHVGGDRADVRIALDAVSVLGDGARLAGGARTLGGASGFANKPGSGALSLDSMAADPFAALPDSTRLAVRAAQRLSAAASDTKSATAHELAAGRWEHVLRDMPPSGAAANAARYRVAEARYGAWHAAPSATRASATTRSLDAFLAAAPAGAQRDLALRWRAALAR